MYKNIKVTAYSGGRGDERPLKLHTAEGCVHVEVTERWVEEDYITRQRKRFFKLIDTDGKEYQVYQDVSTSEWFLRV